MLEILLRTDVLENLATLLILPVLGAVIWLALRAAGRTDRSQRQDEL